MTGRNRLSSSRKRPGADPPVSDHAIERLQSEFRIVGRAAEVRLALACLSAGRNLMLQGLV